MNYFDAFYFSVTTLTTGVLICVLKAVAVVNATLTRFTSKKKYEQGPFSVSLRKLSQVCPQYVSLIYSTVPNVSPICPDCIPNMIYSGYKVPNLS